MKEYGVTFTGENVLKIADGSKRHTRRVIEKIDKFKNLKPGDRLYVQETWNIWTVCYDDYNGGFEIGYPFEKIPKKKPECQHMIDYRADEDHEGPWRPPMFMPKWAARYWLECKATWTERLQDISNSDIEREGIIYRYPVSRKEDFKILWNSINAKRGYTWESNPRVRVIEFKLIKGE